MLQQEIDGLSGIQQEAFEMIANRGEVYQSQFWKELDLSSRKGSRIATTLEEKGLIEREEAVYEGRVTYALRPTQRFLDFSLLMAGDQISPFIGNEEVDPQSDALSSWIMQLTQEHNQSR